jgi:hypothetical protein
MEEAMKNLYTIAIIILVLFFMSSCEPKEEYIFEAKFQNSVLPSSGYARCLDTYLSNGSPDNIYADCTTMYIGNSGGTVYRSALYFDLTSIPPDATVVKAYLKLTTQQLTTTVITVRAYAQSVYWWPGGSGCNVAYSISYDARWNGPWTTPGGDLDRPMSNSVSISYDSEYRALTLDLYTDIVQQWIRNGVSSNPAIANSGMILKSTDEATSGAYCTFITSDNTSFIEFRPLLTIYYKIDFAE